jgi:hypothetical protein
MSFIDVCGSLFSCCPPKWVSRAAPVPVCVSARQRAGRDGVRERGSLAHGEAGCKCSRATRAAEQMGDRRQERKCQAGSRPTGAPPTKNTERQAAGGAQPRTWHGRSLTRVWYACLHPLQSNPAEPVARAADDSEQHGQHGTSTPPTQRCREGKREREREREGALQAREGALALTQNPCFFCCLLSVSCFRFDAPFVWRRSPLAAHRPSK